MLDQANQLQIYWPHLFPLIQPQIFILPNTQIENLSSSQTDQGHVKQEPGSESLIQEVKSQPDSPSVKIQEESHSLSDRKVKTQKKYFSQYFRKSADRYEKGVSNRIATCVFRCVKSLGYEKYCKKVKLDYAKYKDSKWFILIQLMSIRKELTSKEQQRVKQRILVGLTEMIHRNLKEMQKKGYISDAKKKLEDRNRLIEDVYIKVVEYFFMEDIQESCLDVLFSSFNGKATSRIKEYERAKRQFTQIKGHFM